MSPSTLISFTSDKAAMTRSVKVGRSILLKQVANYRHQREVWIRESSRHTRVYLSCQLDFKMECKERTHIVSYAVFLFSRPSSSMTVKSA
jgi:hypothetical protein